MIKKGAKLLAVALPLGAAGYIYLNQTNPVGLVGSQPIHFEGIRINTPDSNGGQIKNTNAANSSKISDIESKAIDALKKEGTTFKQDSLELMESYLGKHSQPAELILEGLKKATEEAHLKENFNAAYSNATHKAEEIKQSVDHAVIEFKKLEDKLESDIEYYTRDILILSKEAKNQFNEIKKFSEEEAKIIKEDSVKLQKQYNDILAELNRVSSEQLAAKKKACLNTISNAAHSLKDTVVNEEHKLEAAYKQSRETMHNQINKMFDSYNEAVDNFKIKQNHPAAAQSGKDNTNNSKKGEQQK